MFENLNAFVLSAIIVLSGGIGCLFIGRWLRLGPALALALVGWHTLLGYYYSSFAFESGGDAFNYYQKARFDFVEASFGTDFIVWLSSFPVSLGLGYGPLSFLYNVLGTIGLLFFCAALRETPVSSSNSTFGRLIILLCVFLPSLGFWTSGIGKDAPGFLSVGIFLWSTMKLARRQLFAIIAILIMLPVRPHIAALMVLSAAAGTLFVSELRASVRFGVAALATAGAVFFVPLALVYSGSARFMSIGEFISDRQEQNLAGGSSVDIASMNPVFRFLSYMYRPLPNEAADASQLAASLDNMILICLTLAALVALYRAGMVSVFRKYSIPLLYGLGSLVLLSQVTANLGLAARQKWIGVPALMLVLAGAWGMAVERDRKRSSSRPLVMARPQS
ncbi:MAG TPA: hypothetical protein VJ775_02840 [Sphingomicrobium sp.]|nr:hypothetical protein [Sphingomicrobium sp.]